MKNRITNKKMFTFALLSAFGLTFIGSNFVLAGGFPWQGALNPADVAEHQLMMFEHQAEMLGIDIEVVKQGWAEGKNFREIAEENGISVEALQEKIRAEQQARMEEHLKAMVDSGVITEDQADSRLEFMKARGLENGPEGRGIGMGQRRGFKLNQ